MSDKFQSFKDHLERAEENVRVARKNTGIFRHQWRVQEAEDIRDQAQRAYNHALRQYGNTLTELHGVKN